MEDGSSHLLLHLHGNSSELIRSKDPKKLKGKYKYRLKKVGLLEGQSSEENPETNPVKYKSTPTRNSIESYPTTQPLRNKFKTSTRVYEEKVHESSSEKSDYAEVKINKKKSSDKNKKDIRGDKNDTVLNESSSVKSDSAEEVKFNKKKISSDKKKEVSDDMFGEKTNKNFSEKSEKSDSAEETKTSKKQKSVDEKRQNYYH